MLTRLLLVAAAAGYAAAWLLQVRAFRAGRDDPRRASLGLAAAAAAVHLAALLLFWATERASPLVGAGPASATLALALAGGFFFANRTPERWSVGLLVLPLVLILLGAAIWVGFSPTRPVTPFRGAWLATHICAVLAGTAGLFLGSVAGAMYLFQFRALKRKEFGKVFRFFPSLESLDRMSRIGLTGGLGVLALGLLAGWAFTLTFGQGLALGDADVRFGLLTWTAYAAALATRWISGGFGPRAAGASVVAFAVSAAGFLAFRALGTGGGFFL